MKKTFELLQISPYNGFTGGRFVMLRNIWTGYTTQRYYYIRNKRKIVDLLRKDDVMCPHYVYR